MAKLKSYTKLAEDGIYHYDTEGELMEDLSELNNIYEFDWKGHGWYKFDYDNLRVNFLARHLPTKEKP